MTCNVYPLNHFDSYKYVVILSEYQGKILLSRHKRRSTWETQGGHIEAGETPLDAAKRELYEESGALDYSIEPLCDYWAGVEGTDDWATGVVFHAVIHSLGQMPESEMAEISCFDQLPNELTYPAITPVLFHYLFESKSRIRIPTTEDAQILANIQIASWKAAFSDILKPDILESLTQIDKNTKMYQVLLETKKGHGYLLEVSGESHCIAWWDQARDSSFAGYAELICIHSLPNRWHCGYGSQMMNRVLNDMRSAGYQKVMLLVFEKNQRAISFYRKHGFSPAGKSQEAFGATEIAMERNL